MYQSSYYQPQTRFSVFPPVIKNLLILNGLFFFAQMVPSTADLLGDWLALWPIGVPQTFQDFYGSGTFYPWQLISYAFLHGSFTHLLFNMLALWMFGVEIENTWGSRRFSIFYFVCVVGAALAQLAVQMMDMQEGRIYPTVGASGGVYGVLLAFGMMFPERPIYIYFLFPIKAKYFVVGYGLLELFSGVTGTQSGVAHFAHLGGMVIGFFLILYWRGKLPVRPKQLLYW